MHAAIWWVATYFVRRSNRMEYSGPCFDFAVRRAAEKNLPIEPEALAELIILRAAMNESFNPNTVHGSKAVGTLNVPHQKNKAFCGSPDSTRCVRATF